MRLHLFVIIILSMIIIVSANPYSYNLYNNVTTYGNVISNNTNSSEYWITNIGSLNDVNATQFNNNGEILTIDTSWLESFGDLLWCSLTGCTMQGAIDMDGNNINNINNLSVDGYIFGQPLDGTIGSGIINSTSNSDSCGCINIIDNGGLNVTYPSLVVKLTDYDGTTTYCDIPEDTITVTNNAHTVYYIDNTCTLQSETWNNWFAQNIINSDKKRIFDVFTFDGDIEILKGAAIENLVDRKKKWININCGGSHLSICDGIDIAEDIFPKINQTLGSYRYIDTQVPTDTISSSINGIHITHHSGGDWVHSNTTEINLTYCDNGTDYIPCSNNKYRQYIIYSIGWENNTILHQLAPTDSVYFSNLANCIDDASNGISYTIPSNEDGIAVIHHVLCSLRDEDTWDDVAWIDLRTAGVGAGGSPDLSPFVTYNDWSKNVNGSPYNITASNFIGSWNGSSDYYLNSNPYGYLNSSNLEDGTSTGQMAFWNGTKWVKTETSEMFWDDVNKRLGIGTATPDSKFSLTINDDTQYDPFDYSPAGDAMWFANDDSDADFISNFYKIGSSSRDGGGGVGSIGFQRNSDSSFDGYKANFFVKATFGLGGVREVLRIKNDGKSYFYNDMDVDGDIIADNFSNLEDGTSTGQMAFWNGTKWLYTETDELFWDDVNKKLDVNDTITVTNLSIYEGIVEKTPVNDSDIVNKKYVDDSVGGGGGHIQNTDTGTNSSTFQLDDDSSGLKLKNSAGTLEIRDSTDSYYGDFIMGNWFRAIADNSVPGIVAFEMHGFLPLGYIYQIKKSRGTSASPSAVAQNDGIFNHDYRAHDGTSYKQAGGFGVFVDGAVSTGIVPTSWYVNTMDTSGNVAQRFIVKSDGEIGIGTSTPSYPLEVNINTSNISIYSQTQVSATGYITRTSIFDKTKNVWDYIKDADYFKKGNDIDHKKFYGYTGEFEVTDYSKPKVNLKCFNTTVLENYTYIEEVCDFEDILFSDYYEYICKNVSRQGNRNIQDCSIQEKCSYIKEGNLFNKVCEDVEVCTDKLFEVCEDEVIYPNKKMEEGVELGREIDVLRQATYELKTENEMMKLDLCSLGVERWC